MNDTPSTNTSGDVPATRVALGMQDLDTLLGLLEAPIEELGRLLDSYESLNDSSDEVVHAYMEQVHERTRLIHLRTHLDFARRDLEQRVQKVKTNPPSEAGRLSDQFNAQFGQPVRRPPGTFAPKDAW
jgi:hypothetical protein